MGLSDLFDFLFSNIVFVIALLGGIYSFFKRHASQQKKQSSKPIPKKASSPKVEEVRRRETVRQVNRQTTRTKTVEMVDKVETKTSIENIVPKEHTVQPVKKVNNKKVSRTAARNSGLLSAEPDHIIQGVIWSEILGPPRAKTPHLNQQSLQRQPNK